MYVFVALPFCRGRRLQFDLKEFQLLGGVGRCVLVAQT